MELEVLNDVVVKQEYQVRVVNGFAVLKTLGTDIDISGAYQSIMQNVKISAKVRLGCYTSVQHKFRFHEEYSRLLQQSNKLNCSGFGMQTK
jgi:hypothetical protein